MQTLFRYLNYYLPVRDFLYILQLEEYEVRRYLLQIGPRLLKRNFEKRDKLKFTSRVKITCLVFAIIIFFIIGVLYFLSPSFLVILLIFLPFLTPYLIACTSLLINIPISRTRSRVIAKASVFFKEKYPNTKVVAITGSYGKTTTKYLLLSLLEYSYKTEIVPENINTTPGIANYLLAEKIPTNTNYLIVEMGAYIQGDIAECASMLPPDISLITKLGDQHIERFGSFENLVKAKNEIFKGTKSDGKKVTTKEAADFLNEFNFKTDDVIVVDVPSDESGNKLLAIEVAKELAVKPEFITDALAKFKPPERRNQTYTKDGVTVVDNSYNISPQTAEKMVHEAKRLANNENKQLVVLTGGIGEQGIGNNEANRNFGLLLNEYATRIILNPSIYSSSVKRTLKKPFLEAEFDKDIIENLTKHVDGEKEILLYLTGHTDLAYL